MIKFIPGKTPARNMVKFRFTDFVKTSVLPTPPATFGHDKLMPRQRWKMLANDKYGDCVWAGAAHETILWNAGCNTKVSFTNKSVLSDYSAATGFNPKDPSTDNGSDMQAAASYRRKAGIVDAHGTRHQIAAYLALEPGNIQQHLQALYIFHAVGIGINFPGSAMDQFNESKPWDVVRGSQIEGGHYIPLVAKRSNLVCVTWGKEQELTDAFFKKYNDESVVYVSAEMLSGKTSPEGFDFQGLQDALKQL